MSVTLWHHLPMSKPLLNRRQQFNLFLASLIITDSIMLGLAFGLAYVIRFQTGWSFFDDTAMSQATHLWLTPFIAPIWLAIFYRTELYNPHYLFNSTQEYKKVLTSCCVAFTLVVVGTFFVPYIRVSRAWIVISCVTVTVFVSIGRVLLRRVALALRAHGRLTSRAFIIGTDEEARAIARQITSIDSSGMKIIGFIDRGIPIGTKIESGLEAMGTIDMLPNLTKMQDIDELIISPSALRREDVLQIFQLFGHSNEIELRFSPGLFEIYTSGVRVKDIGNVSLISMRKVRLDGIESAVKRAMDIFGASLGMILLFPLFCLTTFLIKLGSPGSIFYRRRVVGSQGKEFYAFKFRTMYETGDEILAQCPELKAELDLNHKLKEDPRITPFGHFLRKYSLDELPQLMNVWWGNMSLVGPRMITLPELEKYGKWRLNLWTVKPGITGLWQVSGRSDVSYDERVRMDLYYIRNYTFWSDLKILLKTLPIVFGGKGAY